MHVTWVDIFAFTCIFFIFAYLLYILNYAIALYELNPFNRPKPLSPNEIHSLESKIEAVSNLDSEQRIKLYQRISWFRARKHFNFRGPVAGKRELELLISAAGCLLTLGINNYKYRRSIHRIVVYPSEYYSIINKKHHLGEYNVGLKTLVFAADNLLLGFEDSHDNRNLAIHEFSHALFYETKGRNSWESLKFQAGFRKIERMLADDSFQAKITSSKYFREYGTVNLLEFFAVISENFVESPQIFKKDFPILFDVLKKMFNLEFS